MAAGAMLRTLPYAWYADPAVARVEQERLFAVSWQYAARADQVAEPGQLTTAFAGSLPVVLARARDGVLRGFVNVCRHRGHPLCDGDARRETIQCPYHAWTYSLDGVLRNAPRADREPGFDREALGLVPVSVDTWGPFVFVNPDPTAAPLADALGELPALLADGGLDVDALRFHARAVSDEYAANWKVCVENFLECYHCAVAHPTLTKALDVSPDRYALETRGRLATQVGPPRDGGGGVYDATGEIERGQFHLLFPNTVVNVMPGRPNLSIGPVLPQRQRSDAPLPRLLRGGGRRRVVARGLPRARRAGRCRGPGARRGRPAGDGERRARARDAPPRVRAADRVVPDERRRRARRGHRRLSVHDSGTPDGGRRGTIWS